MVSASAYPIEEIIYSESSPHIPSGDEGLCKSDESGGPYLSGAFMTAASKQFYPT